MNFQFDNFGLPYTNEDDDGSKALQNLALYFINLYCHKKIIDVDFRVKHPPRERLESEPLDEYDGYITAHNNAYRAMLEKQGLNYLAEADIHLWEKVSGITYGNDQLQIHPALYPRQMNTINLSPMLCVLLLFGFLDVLKAQAVRMSSIQDGRKNAPLRYINDVWLLLKCRFSDEQNVMAELVVTKDIAPTMFSELARKLFLSKTRSTWPSIIKYLQR